MHNLSILTKKEVFLFEENVVNILDFSIDGRHGFDSGSDR